MFNYIWGTFVGQSKSDIDQWGIEWFPFILLIGKVAIEPVWRRNYSSNWSGRKGKFNVWIIQQDIVHSGIVIY